MKTKFAGIEIEYGCVYGEGKVLDKVNETLSKKPTHTRYPHYKAHEVVFFSDCLVILDKQFAYPEMIVLTYIELNE